MNFLKKIDLLKLFKDLFFSSLQRQVYVQLLENYGWKGYTHLYITNIT